ncbi:MAG: TIGR03905 family TSCPD domain-containing protein [Ruminococcus sp.]|nr:TIGR03905 family TSCPD domain-containing protein [Ruminococcus sp.]
MQYTYTPHGVCSRQILIDVKDDIIQSVRFVGGCNGNTQGIGALVKGMPVQEVVERLEHIHCGNRPTSCPDQLAKALKEVTAASAKPAAE